MSYDGSDNLEQIDEERPQETEQPASVIAAVARETRRVFKTVFQKEHKPDGEHADEFLKAAHVANKTIPGGKLTDGSVTETQLAEPVKTKLDAGPAENSVGSDQLKEGAVQEAHIGDQQVTPGKLAGGSESAQILVRQTGGAWEPRTISGGAVLHPDGRLLAESAFPIISLASTNAGAASAGWNQRTLNLELYDSTDQATLSGGRVRLLPGKYVAFFSAVAYGVGAHFVSLRRADPSADIAHGSTVTAMLEQTVSEGRGVFTVTDETHEYELRTWAEDGKSGNGLGRPSGSAEADVYAQLLLFRIGEVDNG